MARPKGSMNKNSKFLLNRLQDMYGEQFDPVMKMAQQAVKLDELIVFVCQFKMGFHSTRQVRGRTRLN